MLQVVTGGGIRGSRIRAFSQEKLPGNQEEPFHGRKSKSFRDRSKMTSPGGGGRGVKHIGD